MTKILSKSGDSLADAYDVEGSIAGIDTLETRELPIVHEMGGTVFSERMGGRHTRMISGALLQTVTFDITSTDITPGVNRLLGVMVFGDAAARVSHAMVAIRDPVTGREFPIFIWDSVNNVETTIRIIDNDGAVATQFALIGSPTAMPSFAFGPDQPQSMPELVFRGATLTFGAGNVTLKALVYRTFASVASGLSSRGLPVPGW